MATSARGCSQPKPVGTRDYFEEVEARKYFVESHIPAFADFERWRGKKVLEIGCGIGTDTINFARHGALVTAVDLTEKSLEVARQRAKVFGLEDRIRFYHANAEQHAAARRATTGQHTTARQHGTTSQRATTSQQTTAGPRTAGQRASTRQDAAIGQPTTARQHVTTGQWTTTRQRATSGHATIRKYSTTKRHAATRQRTTAGD